MGLLARNPGTGQLLGLAQSGAIHPVFVYRLDRRRGVRNLAGWNTHFTPMESLKVVSWNLILRLASIGW